ncbi:MAG: VOC family protein [Rickettsiales bacterium]|nr:VOC family protein [Rickettsiales bacterium]
MTRPFHLAIPVNNLESSLEFYLNNFNVKIGRKTEKWCDLNFFGHQLSLHIKPEETGAASKNQVDGKQVPVRHFGVILKPQEWQELADRLQKNKIDFIIEPYMRFKGEVGEQSTMFFLDLDGNALEFKAFQNDDMIFEQYAN